MCKVDFHLKLFVELRKGIAIIQAPFLQMIGVAGHWSGLSCCLRQLS